MSVARIIYEEQQEKKQQKERLKQVKKSFNKIVELLDELGVLDEINNDLTIVENYIWRD